MAGKAVIIDTLTPEDRRAGYVLVELGPKLRNKGGQADRAGIFHEYDERHPNNNEALVVAGKVVKVFATPLVRDYLARELLVESAATETPIQNVSDLIDQIAVPGPSAAQLLALQVENAAKDEQIAALTAKLSAQPATGAPVPDTDKPSK